MVAVTRSTESCPVCCQVMKYCMCRYDVPKAKPSPTTELVRTLQGAAQRIIQLNPADPDYGQKWASIYSDVSLAFYTSKPEVVDISRAERAELRLNARIVAVPTLVTDKKGARKP